MAWRKLSYLLQVFMVHISGDRQSLLQRRLTIIGQKLCPSTLTHSKNCSPDVDANILCVPTRFGSQPNNTCNACWSVFAGPNEEFASCSHYITRLLTSLIRLCEQGLIRNTEGADPQGWGNEGNFPSQILNFPEKRL